MSQKIARIAVSDAVFSMDRPYDYLIPEELACKVQTGVRVHIPFAKGNHVREGIVLSVTDHSEYEKLKSVIAVLDDQPVLSPAQIQLALFMQQRFFCTVYDAVKAMLPVGMWFDDEGERRTKDKYVEVARLAVPPRMRRRSRIINAESRRSSLISSIFCAVSEVCRVWSFYGLPELHVSR